jgi:hypothetical protein
MSMRTLKEIYDARPESGYRVWASSQEAYYFGAAAMAEVFASGGLGAMAAELKTIREALTDSNVTIPRELFDKIKEAARHTITNPDGAGLLLDAIVEHVERGA